MLPLFALLFVGIKQFLTFGSLQFKQDFKKNKTSLFFETFSIVVFIVVSASMLAGANELLNQTVFSFNFPLWSIVLVIISTIIINFGINGLLKLSFCLVPLIIFGIVFVCVQGTIVSNHSAVAFATDIPNLIILGINSVGYCFFNLITANKVIAESGTFLNKNQIKNVSLISGLIIVGIVGVIIVSLLINDSAVLYANLPLVYLAFLISKPVGYMFSIVIFLSVITTIFSTQYSIVNCKLSCWFNKKKNGKTFSSILSAIVILVVSFVGFNKIIKYFYPIVGAVGFAMFLFARKLSLKPCFNSANNKVHSSRQNTK